MTTRVLIADNHAVFRAGLRSLVEQTGEFEVVGEAADFSQVMPKLTTCGADVLLLDIGMPGPSSAMQVIEAALESMPALKIVVLTMYEDGYYLREAFRVGAHGFVLKKSEASHLLAALEAVAHGGRYADPTLGGELLAEVSAPSVKRSVPPLMSLTAREREVCRLLALGHTNGEIATHLSLSERTVEAHRRNLMSKLDVKSRAELVRFAIDSGLIKLA